MMKKIIDKFNILFCITACTVIWSQASFPKTPEVNTLDKFDGIPTSDYTGTKGFEIPIYNIIEGDIALPISLRYHASGIMLEDISGKYGLGWILDIGGLSFTYQKYGKEDTHLWVPTTQNMGDLNISNTTSNQFAFYNTSNLYPEDSQPDIFSYGTPKNKGKFIIDKKKPLFFPPSNVVLDATFLNNAFTAPNTVQNLKPSLLDTSGIQYFFNNATVSYGGTGSGLINGGLYNSINWEISKIKLLNNDEIIFNYDNNSYNYIAGVSRRMEIAPYDMYYTDPYCSTNSGLYEEISKTSVNEKVLKEILFSQGKIEFVYNDKLLEPREDVINGLYLKQIKIYNKANELVKTVSLNYSYNTSVEPAPSLPVALTYNETKTIQKRLILDNVLDSSTGKYTIDYYSSNAAVPNRLSCSKDHWGFYNAKSNTTDIPATFINGSQYGSADRKSDINYAKQFSIKSLQYPTGGKHLIDYELNDYYVSGNITKDTLLVKTLEDDNGFVGMSKTFDFTIDYLENYQITFACAYPQISDPNQVIQGENYAIYNAQLFKDGQLIFSTSSPYDSFTKKLSPGVYNLKIGKTAHYNESPSHHFELFLTGNHTYEEPFSGNLESGGLRVNSYKIYDNNQLVKNYNYEYKIPETNKSSGISYPLYLSSILVSSAPKLRKNGAVDGQVSPNFEASCLKYTISNNNNGISPNLIGRSSVGYSYVTEIVNSLDNKKYSTIRKYINHNIDNDDLVQNPDEPININDFSIIYEFAKPQFVPLENGTLLKETLKNELGVKVKETDFEYDLDYFFNNKSSANDMEPRYIFSGWIFSRKKYIEVPGQEIISNSESNESAEEIYNLWHMFNYNAARYLIPSNWLKLKTQTSREFLGNQILETKTEYTYDETYKHFNPRIIKTYFAGQNINQNFYKYSQEKSNQLMIDRNMIDISLETEIKKDGKTISKTEILYPINQTEADAKTSGLVLPYKVNSTDLLNVVSTEVTYDKYDTKGNLQQYTTKNGISTAIIWGYNQTQPIAKIEGAKLSDISQSLIDTIVSASNTDAAAALNNDEAALLATLNTFSTDASLSRYQITTYTYDPLVGVRSITPPSGIREVYIYDFANRLKEVREQSQTGKLLKEYQYNYKH